MSTEFYDMMCTGSFQRYLRRVEENHFNRRLAVGTLAKLTRAVYPNKADRLGLQNGGSSGQNDKTK